MVYLPTLATAAAAVCFAKYAVAHPGEKHDHEKLRREIKQREVYGMHIARSLEKCARSPNAQMLEERAIKRREAATRRLRDRAGLQQRSPAQEKRDEAALESWGNESHNETGTYQSPYNPSDLFGSNTSCVLTPEDVVGPYYVLGELIRSNVTETQSGVPVHLDMQFVDVATCEPMASSLLVDLWHANSTGVYSGVDGEGGLNTDFLRGVQQTDDDGVVAFDTIFPGHYQGRATHMHVTTHANSTILDNNTYTGGTVLHIGQLFFEEALRSAVEAVEPYASNTQEITSNNDDSLAPEQASTEYDPYVKYVYLGDSVSDGLVMWISIGVDTTANYTSEATAAAYWGEDGGYSSGNSAGGAGGSGGAPGGSGGAPSGASMTGAAPSGASGSPPSGSGMPSGVGGNSSNGGVGGVAASGSSSVRASSASSQATTSALSIPLFTSGGSLTRASTSPLSFSAGNVGTTTQKSSSRSVGSIQPVAASASSKAANSVNSVARPVSSSAAGGAGSGGSRSTGRSSAAVGQQSASAGGNGGGVGSGACRRPSGTPPSGFYTLPSGSRRPSGGSQHPHGTDRPFGSGLMDCEPPLETSRAQMQTSKGQVQSSRGQTTSRRT